MCLLQLYTLYDVHLLEISVLCVGPLLPVPIFEVRCENILNHSRCIHYRRLIYALLLLLRSHLTVGGLTMLFWSAAKRNLVR